MMRALPCLLTVLLAGCSQTPNAIDVPGTAEVKARPRGSRTATRGQPDVGPSRATMPVYAKLDGLIADWDEAQSSGQVDQAATLEQQIRYEVDASDATLQSGARGDQGLAAQYLSVSALGFSSNPASTRTLVEVLRSNDPQLVGNALIAIKLRADPETPLGPLLAYLQRGAPTAARRYAPLALAHVIEARTAARRPSESGTTASAVSRLSGMAADPDPIVRLHTARALGAISTPSAFDALALLIDDDHDRVRFAAAAALERTGDIRGFPHVLRLLNDTAPEAKHVVRDLLVSYAERMQGTPLVEAELSQLGTGSRAWSQWFSDYKMRRGIRPGSRQAAALKSASTVGG